VTSSFAFFLGPICFWTSLILALSWVAAYAAGSWVQGVCVSYVASLSFVPRGESSCSLLRWSSHMEITSSTASTGAKRLRWLPLIASGLPPRSVTVSPSGQYLGLYQQQQRGQA